MPDTAALGLRRTRALPQVLVTVPRLALRSLALILLLAYGLLLALLVRMDPTNRLRPEPLGRHWSRGLLRLLDVRVTTVGRAHAVGGLIVANHVSWLDIPLTYAQVGTRFVSKSEVQAWPVAGWLADAAGTFYLRRGQHGSRALLGRLVPFLRGGGSVVVFPEGTTSRGQDVLPFHPRLFAAAIESGRPVQPVALRYAPDANGESLAPFVDDDDLVSHLLRLLRHPGLEARVVFTAPLDSAGCTREQLAEAAREAIRAA
jgi:lyso-ornithine lipid O-acyltransferase